MPVSLQLIQATVSTETGPQPPEYQGGIMCESVEHIYSTVQLSTVFVSPTVILRGNE